MLQPEYIKDMKSSYLLLRSMEGGTLGYGSKMLVSNNIPGLLKVEIRCFDELNVYYYDISNKKSILDYYDKVSLKFEDINHILTSVISILDGSLEYLLHENDFILEPGYVFVNPITNEMFLCHLVGYQVNVQTQISSFIEYLMNKVDYKDEKAVLLVYSLYKESREASCTYGKLLSELNKKSDDKEIQILKKEELEPSNNFHHTVNKAIIKGAKNRLDVIPKKEKDIKSQVLRKVSGKDNLEKWSADLTYKHLLSEAIGEEERLYYSKRTYLLAILSIGIGIVLFIVTLMVKLLHNTFKTQLEPIKVLCFLIILGTIEVYILYKLFQDSNKITKMVSTVKYEKDSKNVINDIELSTTGLEDDDKTVSLYEDKNNEISDATEVLVSFEPKLFLKPLDKDNYKYIILSSFPYLIGKSQKTVNHCLNHSTISRIHSRFEKNENEIYLVDLNSLNGTFLNGERLAINKPYKISEGDKVSFSHLNYILQVE